MVHVGWRMRSYAACWAWVLHSAHAAHLQRSAAARHITSHGSLAHHLPGWQAGSCGCSHVTPDAYTCVIHERRRNGPCGRCPSWRLALQLPGLQPRRKRRVLNSYASSPLHHLRSAHLPYVCNGCGSTCCCMGLYSHHMGIETRRGTGACALRQMPALFSRDGVLHALLAHAAPQGRTCPAMCRWLLAPQAMGTRPGPAWKGGSQGQRPLAWCLQVRTHGGTWVYVHVHVHSALVDPWGPRPSCTACSQRPQWTQWSASCHPAGAVLTGALVHAMSTCACPRA